MQRRSALAVVALLALITGMTFFASPAHATHAACHDGIDNDGDGWRDYPEDQGCSSVDDATESCPTSIASGVVACVSQGALVTRLGVPSVTDGVQHDVYAFLDLYRYLVGDVSVTIPCVTLAADASEVNPCEALGGARQSRTPLQHIDVDEPSAGPTPLVSVGVCEAELTATVLSVGVNSAPALIAC